MERIGEAKAALAAAEDAAKAFLWPKFLHPHVNYVLKYFYDYNLNAR